MVQIQSFAISSLASRKHTLSLLLPLYPPRYVARKTNRDLSCCTGPTQVTKLRGVSGVRERFAGRRLEDTVNQILMQMAETTCLMVWGLRTRREMEVGAYMLVNESLMEKSGEE